MLLRIAALFLLCHPALSVIAGESAAAGADGDCPPVLGIDEREGQRTPGAHRGDGDSATGNKGTPVRRGDSAGSVRGPRMHNLLPGMFR